MRFSEEILKRVAEAYRKLRNTCRYLLSNLFDFDPKHNAVDEAQLDELDRWALANHRELVDRVRKAYEGYEFHIVYHELLGYCAGISSVYLDILKDRLYCDAPAAPRRRSAQTVVDRILRDLTVLMAPVLPMTADEVWSFAPGSDGSSVHLALFPQHEGAEAEVLHRWQTELLPVRSEVLKKLEEARAAKQIASGLEAQVAIQGTAAELAPLRRYEAGSRAFPGNLANLFIVSRVTLAESTGPLAASVARAAGRKCERCWTFSEQVGKLAVHPGVCERCASVLEAL
jgi:isoleucyl-tRNA synthetase